MPAASSGRGHVLADLEKRTWCYTQPPDTYEIAPCDCGTTATQWSEFKGHLWCAKCQKDFIPTHNGLFDGPIGVELCRMLGISFDTVDLATRVVTPFQFDEK